MRKLWIWLALFAVTSAGIITGWNWQAIQSPPRALETSFLQSQIQPELPPPRIERPDNRSQMNPVAPLVNSERLMVDVEALAGERYTDIDRAKARAYIAQQLQQAGWTPQMQTFENGTNVYAERPGTDSGASSILLGAHFDTVERSPGADDNATAVATVLEATRLLGDRPTLRTLKVAFFDLEETGLHGSFAFTDRETDDIQGAVILEMLGFACHEDGCQQYPPLLPIEPPSDRGDFLAVIGDQGHLPLINRFPQASRPELPQVFTLPVPLMGRFTPDLLRSDHAPFWRKGIGAVMVTDTANFRNPNYHQPSDTLETLDHPFFFGAAQIVVNAVTDLLDSQDSLATDASFPQGQQPNRLPITPL